MSQYKYIGGKLDFSRQRWHQVNADVNSDDHMLDLYIPQSLEAEIEYTIWSAIVQHNLRRCDDISLGNNLGNHSWDQYVNLSIFGVSVVKPYNLVTEYLSYEYTSSALLCDFSEYIIDIDMG